MLEEEMQEISQQEEREGSAACMAQLQDLLQRECEAQAWNNPPPPPPPPPAGGLLIGVLVLQWWF